MNILVLGSGGREHTFAHLLAKSNKTETLYIAPGNAGTANVGTNVAIDPLDFKAVRNFCLDKQIHMLVVGPEAPLVEGITDFFKADKDLEHIHVIGPSKEGAMLEGSKDYAKVFMLEHNIPTAKHQTFSKETLTQALAYLDTQNPPYVLKADGLAAGKGVLILDSLEAAKAQLTEMLLHNKFGQASTKVVIEQFLKGIELSVFVLTDGSDYLILPTAKDYKRIGEGDTGLNTGGMGAISPVPFADAVFMNKVEQQIVIPTINGLKKRQIPYCGFIFIGLINVENNPYVIEYNVRMGDPETEAVLPRIENDWPTLLEKVATNKITSVQLEVNPKTAATVMAVSGGYPEAYEKGKAITGIPKKAETLVFHAGTAIKEGRVVTNGGRVLAVTSFGEDFKEALKKSYAAMKQIQFDKMYYRKDLGFDL